MILPGVSGSLILILLGQYVFLSGELSTFLGSIWEFLLANGTLAGVADPGTTVVVFVAGGAVGLVSVARIVRCALDRQRELTLLFLVGLIAGSVPAPLHNVAEAHPLTIDILLQTGVWAALGAVALFALDRLAGGFDPE